MDFDFGRFGLPNIGNSGNIPKTGKTEKADNVAAPDNTISFKTADASALDATAAQNLGFVRSANNVSAVDRADLAILKGLTTGLDTATLERYLNTTSTVYKRTGEAAKEGFDLALNIGTEANAVSAMKDFDAKMNGTFNNYDEQEALNQFMQEAYAG